MNTSDLIPGVRVPAGAAGPWVIEKMLVDEIGAKRFNMIESLHGSRRMIEPGEYTSLKYRGAIVMSDTPAEKSDHAEAVRIARGRCLVNGLGIGMVVNAMLLKPVVARVTVVEISKDVIDLVAPHYTELFGDRFQVVHADAYTYKPPICSKYDVVWHDIWGDISAENLEGMRRLHRKYGRRTVWQGSWCRDQCEYYARRRVF